MKRLVVAVALAAASCSAAAKASPAPVVVELFTSEGCSSCPPADALLARYVREQPVAGVQIVALSEHVDYWNDLGWRDPFSAAEFTRRQETYARRLGTGLYTPQLVVAGARHLVGSRDGQARAAISAAAAGASAQVVATASPGSAAALDVDARWPRDVDADVLVALVQASASSTVARGENAGRVLEHVAVVRSLSVAGRGRGAFAGRVTLPASVEADRAVVFVQERDGGPIHGAAVVELRRP